MVFLNVGKLSHEDVSTKDVDAGFATVEESAVGKKQINRGKDLIMFCKSIAIVIDRVTY